MVLVGHFWEKAGPALAEFGGKVRFTVTEGLNRVLKV